MGRAAMCVAAFLTTYGPHAPQYAQGRIVGGSIETRRPASSLEQEIRLVTPGPTWIGYRVPMIAGHRTMCCSDVMTARPGALLSPGIDERYTACRLGGGGGVTMTTDAETASSPLGARVQIEPATDVLLLFYVEAGSVRRLRTFTPDCDVDGEGARIIWLEPVMPAESVRWLTGLAAAPGSDPVVRQVIAALALHAEPTAVPNLIEIARRHANRDVRRQAMIWLGRTGDPRAISFFETVLTTR